MTTAPHSPPRPPAVSREPITADVVVIGSGPNGLAAALRCAAAGRHVVVVEASDHIGGGCRTLPLTGMPNDAGDGLLVDPCSAVHPMAAASPFFRDIDLPSLGVELHRPRVQLAHALAGQPALIVDGAEESLAEGLGSTSEARRWWSLFGPLARHSDEVVATALSDQRSLPPVAGIAALAMAASRAYPAPFRVDTLGPAGRTLLSGIASHTIGPLTSPAATGVGLMLGALLHADGGWPIPAGGSGAITDAMASRLRELGGRIITGRRVRSLDEVRARDIVANTSARELGRILLASHPSPATAQRGHALCRTPVGGAAARVDLVLSGPIPWADPRVGEAGTVHLGGHARELAAAERAVASRAHAEHPVILASQPWVADPSRIASDGRRPLWTYAHVPAFSTRDVTEDIVSALEAVAPGIREQIVATRCIPASRLSQYNVNYTGGDIAAGRVDVAGLVARPVPRRDPYATAVPGVWQASASTPPGPGVHGMAGEHVAARILSADR